MNHLAPIALALAASLAIASAVQAADLGWGAPTDAGMFAPSSAFSWSGFYAGVSGGYGWGKVSRVPAPRATIEDETGGWSLGAQAGYNVDFGGFVVGVEGDANWTNLNYTQDLGAAGSFDVGLDAYGSARLRAGATFGQVMPYVTGGLGVARGTVGTTAANAVVNTQSQFHTGWVLGGGLEAAVNQNVTLRAEYLHYDLGAQSYATAGNTDVSHQFGLIRAGINYKF